MTVHVAIDSIPCCVNFDNDATPLPIGQSRTKTKLNSSRRFCDTYYAVRPPSPRHDPPNIKC